MFNWRKKKEEKCAIKDIYTENISQALGYVYDVDL